MLISLRTAEHLRDVMDRRARYCKNKDWKAEDQRAVEELVACLSHCPPEEDFTPGPWVSAEFFDAMGPGHGFYIKPAAGGVDIGEFRVSSSRPEAQQEANAAIAAAAPELFAHADMVCKLFGTDNPQGLKELKEHVGNLRLAVKKAARRKAKAS